MNELIAKLEADAKESRKMGDELAKSAKEMQKMSRQRSITEIERTYYLVLSGSRKTLAIAYHTAAAEVEKVAKELRSIARL